MALVNRATLPQEFQDMVSAKLLLQPEPQYLHAKLFKLALGADLDVKAGLGFGPDRMFGMEGLPYQTDPEAGRLSFGESMMSEAMEVVTELGKAPGHTILVNRPSFTNSTYTEAARLIPSGTSISTTPIAVSSQQVPITLGRYGGPYSSAVQPYGIDRFDGSIMLHKPSQIVGLNLKRDFDRTVNAFVTKLYDNAATANIERPNGMTNDNTAALAGDFPFSYALLAKMETALDDQNCPTFSDGKRVAVLHPRQWEQLQQDSQFSRLSENHKELNALFAGSYCRTVGAFHCFKSTTLTTSVNTNTITIYYAQAFGPGAVGAGLGELPRCALSTSDNYGEHALVIWLMYAGFATLDSNLIGRMTTS